MTSSVLDDLKMAEISLAKVADVSRLAEDAQEVIDDFRTSLRVKEEVQTALSNVESKAGYQITVNTANQVDEVISRNPNLIVHHNGVSVSGNEAFGIDISPSEWRTTRGLVLREMLGETYKNIKRWANQLAENFHRSWLELTTSTDVLRTRLESTDSIIGAVSGIREGATTVELNEVLTRSVSKAGRPLTGDVPKALAGEVNYILSCLRVWEMEQVRYKNSIIRYFGNDKNSELTEISREIPKLFNQRSMLPDDNQGMLFARQTLPMLDGYVFQGTGIEKNWIKDNIHGKADNAIYAESLSLTGYRAIKTSDSKVGKSTMKVFSLSQIYAVRDVIDTIINKLVMMNIEQDPVNFNPDDVKDVLASLKNTDTTESRAYQYGLLTADYQYDVNHFKTMVSSMLLVLASHLVTLLNLHLECYDVE